MAVADRGRADGHSEGDGDIQPYAGSGETVNSLRYDVSGEGRAEPTLGDAYGTAPTGANQDSGVSAGPLRDADARTHAAPGAAGRGGAGTACPPSRAGMEGTDQPSPPIPTTRDRY